ncbi:ankyrin repeat domain-containing protein [Trinickia caryophylli]|uniref:Ankyrin repeat-containing protein n=1 Tax=Trinickia caryophylli TaxID=28094 RepID=A0A1X7F8N9_TRICW|nr:ankyrin repeat domain-containing protein [Trinickia caryophylli]PMS08894.1 hypothetical protein C0Z17_27700 [Trinickia caryophylli]TRX18977.1 ankyrin repeat domain-containing protein [Trinickia caryophylli]WQE10224.1 ankyrin repeat domain-containing protein [Trinickia caryophylli]SMF48142.1 Ankyrin repeat-containing protein [Trinickia caryophylli]GLU34334.1 hypothetical protein Busp01_41760 [Trinickia caryophylli]
MRYKTVAVAGAFVAAIGAASSIWTPAEAQGTHMARFERFPPEAFFTGTQLALAQAIRDGDLARVKALAPKTDLAAPGARRMTLLAFALQEAVPVKAQADSPRLQILGELVKDGAKPEQVFGNDGNVAYMAVRADTPNFLRALLAGGMNPNLRYDGDTPLLFAACQDNLLPMLRLLVEHKADVNIKDSLHETALFGATRLRQWDVVDYLLAHGANPAVANENGLKYAKTLYNELASTPKDSPQVERIEAIRKRVIAAGVQWPPA